MHKKFEINQTKIKGSCQSGRRVVPHDSKSDLFLFVLIWVSLYCRQAIQLQHYFPFKGLFQHSPTAETSAISQPQYTSSGRCMTLLPNTSPSISICGRIQMPAYILGMPHILILQRARHTVFWTQLCHILMKHTGATS